MKVMTEELKFADLFPEEAGKLAQRLHIKKDEIPFLRKSYISEKSEVKPDERAVISYISTAIKDRDGEQLLPEGVILDNYRNNPIVLWGHDYKSMPVGKNLWIKQDEKGLIAKTVFAKNERSDEVYRAYTEDVGGTGPLLRAFSVGFVPIEVEDVDQKELEKNKDLPKRIYKKWELLEYSTVPIPSCPEALTLAREKGLIPDSMKKAMDKYIEVEDFQEEVEIESETKTMTPEELKEHYRGLQEVEVETGQDEEELEVEVTPIPTVVDEESDLQDTVNELIEEGVDVEDLAFDDTGNLALDDVGEKRFDLEGNPSVWDIMDAIRLAVQTPQNSKTYRYVADLYPTKYPDGLVVVEETKEKEKRKYLLHSYEYDNGKVKLGESKELEATYQPKERSVAIAGFSEITEDAGLSEIKEMLLELKEGRVLSRKHRNLVKDCTEALLELLTADSTGSREDEDKEEVEDEKEVEVVLEKGEYSADEIQSMVGKALDKAIANIDIGMAIDQSVKKLQGKVE